MTWIFRVFRENFPNYEKARVTQWRSLYLCALFQFNIQFSESTYTKTVFNARRFPLIHRTFAFPPIICFLCVIRLQVWCCWCFRADASRLREWCEDLQFKRREEHSRSMFGPYFYIQCHLRWLFKFISSSGWTQKPDVEQKGGALVGLRSSCYYFMRLLVDGYFFQMCEGVCSLSRTLKCPTSVVQLTFRGMEDTFLRQVWFWYSL